MRPLIRRWVSGSALGAFTARFASHRGLQSKHSSPRFELRINQRCPRYRVSLGTECRFTLSALSHSALNPFAFRYLNVVAISVPKCSDHFGTEM
jgi:hypothetical protein